MMRPSLNGALLAAVMAVLAPGAMSAPFEYVFTGAGSAQLDQGPQTSGVITLFGYGDTAARVTTNPASGFIFETVPLDRLVIAAPGIGGTARIPGSIVFSNIDQNRFPLFPRTVAMGGISLDVPATAGEVVSLQTPCTRCALSSQLILDNSAAVNFTFNRDASTTTPGVYFVARPLGAPTPPIPRIVLSAPVPEPGAALLMAVAFGALAIRMQRKRRDA